ncbi:MAG: radical SAM protein [Cyanobacteriota bacterium]
MILDLIKKPFKKIQQHSMIYEVTLKCNLNCMYCYNVCKNKEAYPEGELDTDKSKQLLDKIIKETGCTNLTFTGGEPYLRKDIFDLYRHVKDKVFSINVISNGSVLNEDMIKESIDCGIKIFELPLLSSERDIHNSLVRGNSFDRVTESIAYIKSNAGRVVTVFVATKKNIHTWKETIEMALALGADGIMFNRFNPGGEGANHIEELLPSPEELHIALDIANKAVEDYKISIACSIAMPPCIIKTEDYPNLGFGYCAAGTERAYYTVDPIGNLRMCNHSHLILGNLFEKSFHKIARNKKAKEFMNAHPEFCTDCKIVKECQGGCKATAEVCYQNVYLEDPFLKLNKDIAIKK